VHLYGFWYPDTSLARINMKKIIFTFIMVVIMIQAKTYKYTNELIHEDSPYLLQHAHNPVNWMPWSKKAFDKAKKEHKLIFLSIGYSTCHWCHVMEEESFENEEVAKILNDNYVAIKVDREEMPSLDKHFQDVFYLMNKRGGGWPLTLILTPDGKPFFSATYIPREAKYGRMGLIELLKYFANLKKNNYTKIKAAAKDVQKYLDLMEKQPQKSFGKIDSDLGEKFIKGVAKNYDRDNFGIGLAPKFPHASTLKALLVLYELNHDKDALDMADGMLSAMAKGGIYDQIESGFFRYSTDERWMIPHFEKMLYTNAELLEVYALAYRITKKELYKNVANDLVKFLKKRFEKDSLYFSASDADSIDPKTGKKEEGAYFVYEYNEAKNALIKAGIDNFKEILEYLDITEDGNFEGKNNPYIEELTPKPKNLDKAREVLLAIRDKRVYPFVDHKILTSWNALLIKSLFVSAPLNPEFKNYAIASLKALTDKVYIDKKLYHQILLGKNPKVEANLEDYSFLISAFLGAYEATYDTAYLKTADDFAKKAVSKYYIDGIWYSSLKPFRVKAAFDGNAYVSSLGVMVENLLKLALFKENLSYEEIAKDTISSNSTLLSKYPANFPQAVLDSIAFKKGYIIIKSKKEPLMELKADIDKRLSYPFILYKPTGDKTFLACKVDVCFAFSKNKDEIIKKIEKEIKK
jgi:uncharacterized protein YyaL (SSP411 family)